MVEEISTWTPGFSAFKLFVPLYEKKILGTISTKCQSNPPIEISIRGCLGWLVKLEKTPLSPGESRDSGDVVEEISTLTLGFSAFKLFVPLYGKKILGTFPQI